MLHVGYQQPLPVNVLAASKSRFVVMLEKFTQGCSQHHEETSKREFLEKVRDKVPWTYSTLRELLKPLVCRASIAFRP